ncbi:hypothetical protein CEE39_09230 [bacterium (candidate division B38) B3_B38]|nr:MAG: hypothetical protein CEE39_09230 [bacterium (candidate division B38) B3_B38]
MRRSLLYTSCSIGLLALFLLFSGCASNTPSPEQSDSPYVHYRLGDAHLKAGRFKQAIEEFQRAVAFDPLNPIFYNYLGLAYLFDLQYNTAIQAFNRALQLNPNFTDVHNNLGMVYSEMGDIDRARREFQEVIRAKAYATPEVAYFNLGKLSLTEKNYEEAIFFFQKALESNPKLPKVHERRGFTYELMGKLEEAEKEYQEALKLEPKMIEANYNLAMVYFKQQKYSKAKYHFYEVISLAPDTSWSNKAEEFLKLIEKRVK